MIVNPMPTPPAEVFGVPVAYLPTSPLMADARGVWPLKRIVVGPRWMKIASERERLAVLAHEAAHCLKWHLEKRILAVLLLFIRPQFAARLCIEQELDADEFAARAGFGVELLSVLEREREESGMFYPSNAQRKEALCKLIEEIARARTQ